MFHDAESIALKTQLNDLQESGKARVIQFATELNAQCTEARTRADAGLAAGLLTQAERDLVYERSSLGYAIAGLAARAGSCASADVTAWAGAINSCAPAGE